jgi:hypothetical protein
MSVNDSLPQAGESSFQIPDLKDQVSEPIIISGGQINDIKTTTLADDNRLITLEARLCCTYIT